ncbi:hypothetical protein F5Y11DRAFT_364165 [Daldinia sp. FL1419]|nr:hypothetical protein F5Y11DRAFT_364165 [Daldinia sp. FL1419]
MAKRYSGVPPSKGKPRTPDSLVWGTTKAKSLVSAVRFSWNKSQNAVFMDFLSEFGPGYKNSNITELLYRLDLHGYDDIETDNGESVYLLIMEKVQRKLKATTNQMMADGAFELSRRPKKTGSTSVHDDSDEASGPIEDTEDIVASHTPASKPTQQSRPPVKMPQGKVTVKTEPRESSPLRGGTTRIFRPPPVSSISTPPEFPEDSQARRSSRRSCVPQDEKVASIQEKKARRIRQTFQNLVDALADTRAALHDAHLAFLDAPETELNIQYSKMLQKMREKYCDIEVDAEDLYEYSKKGL